jgi:hypothetical protein
MAQYDIDNRGVFSELFQAIRKILLSSPQITEIQNAKQTSYRDAYGMIIMMRSRGDLFVLAFGKGAKLQEKYPMLKGTGKVVRHLYFKDIEELDETLLREMIEESLILNIEAYEMKKLRCNQRNRKSEL